MIIKTYSSECHPQDNEEEVVAVLWRFLISTLIVHAVVKRLRGRIPVLYFVLCYIFSKMVSVSPDLGLLPLCTGLLLVMSIITTYVIAVSLGHVDLFLPAIRYVHLAYKSSYTKHRMEVDS